MPIASTCQSCTKINCRVCGTLTCPYCNDASSWLIGGEGILTYFKFDQNSFHYKEDYCLVRNTQITRIRQYDIDFHDFHISNDQHAEFVCSEVCFDTFMSPEYLGF